MDTEKAERLIREGRTPRQIAEILCCSRLEVLRFIAARQRSANKKRLTAFLVLLATGIIFFAVYYQSRDSNDREVYSRILSAADALPRSASGNSWFMEQAPDRPESQARLIEGFVNELDKILVENSDVPEVKEEMGLFGGSLVATIFVRGNSVWIGKNSNILKDPKMLEIVFYSHDAYTHPKIWRRLFFYDPEWKSLFSAALKFNDQAWHGAIVAHELWHAKRHREGAASATAVMLSDPWVEEELEAHGVESKVLDARTQGAYRNQLRSIVARRSARNIKSFLAKVEPDDIVKLDRLFGKALTEEVDIRAAQYYLDLGLLWLESRYTGAELHSSQIQLYRFLIQPQSTGVN